MRDVANPRDHNHMGLSIEPPQRPGLEKAQKIRAFIFFKKPVGRPCAALLSLSQFMDRVWSIHAQPIHA